MAGQSEDLAQKLNAVEELLQKVTSANENLTQEKEREAKKAKLLETELLSLRASTEEMRKYNGLVQNDAASDALRKELNSKNDDIRRLQAQLDASAPKGTEAQLIRQKEIEIVDLKTRIQQLENESNNRYQQLHGQEQQIGELKAMLGRARAEASNQQARVEVVYQDRYVEIPKVEIKTIEVENVDKISVLINKCRELEQELRKKDNIISDWQAKCARLEQTPAKIVPQVIEIADGKVIRDLIEKLNTKETDLTNVKAQLLQAQAKGDPATNGSSVGGFENYSRPGTQQTLGSANLVGDIDGELQELLKGRNLPVVHKFESFGPDAGTYYFGTLLVELRLQGAEIVAKPLFEGASPYPVSLQQFIDTYAEQELRKAVQGQEGNANNQPMKKINTDPMDGFASWLLGDTGGGT